MIWSSNRIGPYFEAYECIVFFLLYYSGKTDIIWMMLDAGAETDVVNSVGRTAAQMAAFVGMCVACMLRLYDHVCTLCSGTGKEMA